MPQLIGVELVNVTTKQNEPQASDIQDLGNVGYLKMLDMNCTSQGNTDRGESPGTLALVEIYQAEKCSALHRF